MLHYRIRRRLQFKIIMAICFAIHNNGGRLLKISTPLVVFPFKKLSIAVSLHGLCAKPPMASRTFNSSSANLHKLMSGQFIQRFSQMKTPAVDFFLAPYQICSIKTIHHETKTTRLYFNLFTDA